jgi:hypothetical protein
VPKARRLRTLPLSACPPHPRRPASTKSQGQGVGTPAGGHGGCFPSKPPSSGLPRKVCGQQSRPCGQWAWKYLRWLYLLQFLDLPFFGPADPASELVSTLKNVLHITHQRTGCAQESSPTSRRNLSRGARGPSASLPAREQPAGTHSSDPAQKATSPLCAQFPHLRMEIVTEPMGQLACSWGRWRGGRTGTQPAPKKC